MPTDTDKKKDKDKEDVEQPAGLERDVPPEGYHKVTAEEREKGKSAKGNE